jgi:hypothetical protein
MRFRVVSFSSFRIAVAMIHTFVFAITAVG